MDTGKNQGHWGSLVTATLEERLQSRSDKGISRDARQKQKESLPKEKLN